MFLVKDFYGVERESTKRSIEIGDRNIDQSGNEIAKIGSDRFPSICHQTGVLFDYGIEEGGH
jgi:hypothetical protein